MDFVWKTAHYSGGAHCYTQIRTVSSWGAPVGLWSVPTGTARVRFLRKGKIVRSTPRCFPSALGADSIIFHRKPSEIPSRGGGRPGGRYPLRVAGPSRSTQPTREPKNRKIPKFRDFRIFANDYDCIHDVTHRLRLFRVCNSIKETCLRA